MGQASKIQILKAKIAVLTQMRDAVKEVAVQHIYKSIQHRDDVQMAILEALEDLEDQLETLEDQEMEADDE